MEVIELQRCHEEDEVKCVTEARRLAILVGDISMVLHSHASILRIPPDPCTAGNVLEDVGTILEHLWEAHAFGHSA
jgi:hypothetical protein